MPTLEKLYRQDPESIPFRNEVDPVRECVPDYYDIIKTPMDLSKIKDKLERGMYSDPWEYVDDVWLMFDNAWLYNRKTSRVYRYCTKVLYLHLFPHTFIISTPFVLCVSCRRFLNKRLILWCRRLATAAAANIHLILRFSAATASNCAPFRAMLSTSATRTGNAHSSQFCFLFFPLLFFFIY